MMQRGDGGKVVGMQELEALAEHADTIPVNRIWVAFFDPTLVYEAGSNTFADTGMETGSSAADLGFAEVKKHIKTLQDAGVEVFLSMGGWNYNCFPALYTRYSIGGYGDHTPNYWKIETYGKGSIDGCTEDNMWCWTCEPESEGTTLDSFAIFPEPQFSAGWDAAKKYVESKTTNVTAIWHPDMAPGSTWTDEKTGQSLKVPGKSKFNDMKRDPYEDFVLMAQDLGAAGVDIDYEEMWHADYFKTGDDQGPWDNTQTTYKYVAIAKDMIDAVDKHAPNLKITTAAGAVGAWEGKWWGGNLKGVWSRAKKMFPEVTDRLEINVMTYDLSSNQDFHECPDDQTCDLDAQVEFYMKTYRDAGFSANVGYEVGQPAYPDVTQDKEHQVPLDADMLDSILSKTQPQHPGGFFWELYKPAEGHAPANDVAQKLCKQVLGDDQRCSGTIPSISGSTLVV